MVLECVKLPNVIRYIEAMVGKSDRGWRDKSCPGVCKVKRDPGYSSSPSYSRERQYSPSNLTYLRHMAACFNLIQTAPACACRKTQTPLPPDKPWAKSLWPLTQARSILSFSIPKHFLAPQPSKSVFNWLNARQ